MPESPEVENSDVVASEDEVAEQEATADQIDSGETVESEDDVEIVESSKFFETYGKGLADFGRFLALAVVPPLFGYVAKWFAIQADGNATFSWGELFRDGSALMLVVGIASGLIIRALDLKGERGRSILVIWLILCLVPALLAFGVVSANQTSSRSQHVLEVEREFAALSASIEAAEIEDPSPVVARADRLREVATENHDGSDGLTFAVSATMVFAVLVAGLLASLFEDREKLV